jgi:POT family proton-dependent oligopeptide transporter
MLWQIIQYALLTAAEILVSITVLIFAYAEAPKRYKVVILSYSLFIASVGDLIVIFVALVRLTENQVS